MGDVTLCPFLTYRQWYLQVKHKLQVLFKGREKQKHFQPRYFVGITSCLAVFNCPQMSYFGHKFIDVCHTISLFS